MTAVRPSWKAAALLAAATSTVFHRPPPTSTNLQSREILLATTTSTRDAGLLDSLLPLFERETGYQVKVIAVGSGQALALGRRGDADVVLSHAPDAERVLVDSGYLLRRRLVMHNDFLIVGPATDPAGLRGLTDAVAALRRVAAARALFVSRGDRSGTNLLELKLWNLAAIALPHPAATEQGGGWYLDAGQGMAATLQMADEKRAYTITDRATYLAWRDRVQLVPLAEGDPVLYNVYHVMEVNPRNAPRVNAVGARALADWLVAPATQRLIGAFGMSRFGQSLFVPDAGKTDRW